MSDANKEKRPRLKVFKGFAPGEESLRPGYAYLIRSSVRMPELYPLLGELLFASRVTGGEEETPPNVIGMFIEDSPDNLMLNLVGHDQFEREKGKISKLKVGDREVEGENITECFGKVLREPSMAVWIDTFGSFHDASGKLESSMEIGEGDRKHKWWIKSVPGAGNPMAIMRIFRQVQELPADAAGNMFLLNSLSNLYRSLGLADSAAFLKTMLNESIWSDISPVSGNIGGKEGLFFAVLQEDVLDKKETSYLESFFDGIVNVTPCTLSDPCLQVAKVHVRTLPEIVRISEDFVYLPAWQFNPKETGGGGLNAEDWFKRKYIYIRDAVGCVEQKSNGEQDGNSGKNE